jgi:hypothetical protein
MESVPGSELMRQPGFCPEGHELQICLVCGELFCPKCGWHKEVYLERRTEIPLSPGE